MVVNIFGQMTIHLQNLLDDGLETAQLALVFRADDFLKEPVKHEKSAEG